jgi:MFS family permease
VVPLLALAVFINYVDRGNLATAGPLIKTELNLSNTEFGLLVSAFFWVYTPAQLFAGWLAQRFNTYKVMGWGLALWGIATIATGLTSTFAALLALRLLLGLGESVAFPCSSKLIAEMCRRRNWGSPTPSSPSGPRPP